MGRQKKKQQKVAKMSDEEIKLSRMADIQYELNKEKKKFAEENGLITVINTGELTAYKDDINKKIYISHRGTANKKDLAADIAIFFGMEKYQPRFQRAQTTVDELKRKYPDYEIIHTGHSLGGSVAQFVAKKGRSVTFNKGSGLLEPFRLRSKKQTDFTNVFDPVSLTSQFQLGGKTRRQARFSTHPHKIKSSTSTFAK